MKNLNILIGGPAGTGIESVSMSLARAFMREGLHTMTTSEYENLIRGGHNFSSVHIGESEVLTHQLHYEIYIAMDRRSIAEHSAEIDAGGAIIFDSEKTKIDGLEIPDGVAMIGLPMATLAKEAGLLLAANVVALGALFALLDRDFEKMKTVLESIFAKKGAEIIAINLRALSAGFTFVHKNHAHRISFSARGDEKKRFLMTGNEAIALGSIAGGLQFLAAYPMTPGSTIMTTLAKEAQKNDIVVVHAEDEIAAVMMAAGSNYAGVRAATSTSGGGFALMGEAVSFAGQTEIPLVIFNAQRPGPSTGLPTRTGQGDLRMAISCGQGDVPRLVMAVGDHSECVRLSAQAFNFADRFQIPVIVLTEKYLADEYKSCDMNIADDIVIDRGKVVNSAENFRRFRKSADGVSPRAFPGMMDCEHTTTSYEHDEFGQPIEEVSDVLPMMEKRWKKMTSLAAALPSPLVFGTSPVKIFIWGATKNPALAAQSLLAAKNLDIEIIQIQYLFPLKKDALRALLVGAKTVGILEGNQSGQLESLLLEYGFEKPDFSIRNFAGRPMTGEWIAQQIEKFLKTS